MANWPEQYDGELTEQVTRALALKGGVRIAALAGNETWTTANATINFLDPDGSGRTLTLPDEAKAAGCVFWITNTANAAEDLTISDGSTVITISQNESGFLACDGTAWDGFVITGALS